MKSTANTTKSSAWKQLDERLRKLPAWADYTIVIIVSFAAGGVAIGWLIIPVLVRWVNHVLKYGTLCVLLAVPSRCWTQEYQSKRNPATTNDMSLCHALLAAGVGIAVTVGGVRLYYYMKSECVKIGNAKSNALHNATRELDSMAPSAVALPGVFCESPAGAFDLVTSGDDDIPVILCHATGDGEWRGVVDLPPATCRKVWIRATPATSQTK